jgi:hypothetical protein
MGMRLVSLERRLGSPGVNAANRLLRWDFDRVVLAYGE